MYEQFWGLDSKPFEHSEDPRFYFASAEHRAAELKLRYVVESRRGAAMLSGGPGVGKTLLLRVLEQQSQPQTDFLRVQFSQLPPEQLLALLASQLSGDALDASQAVAQSLRLIEEALAERGDDGRHACLVIDEAHGMPSESLETLRMLSNLHHPGQPGLTILLSGQPSLRKALQPLPQLEERLDVKLHLHPLSAEDSASYVRHRLTAAGSERPVFNLEALQQIYQLTRGVPGRINRLCDMALLVAFAEDQPMITPEMISNVDRGLFASPWAA
jgi:general secretion pathway protein A